MRLAPWREWLFAEAAWPDLPFANPVSRHSLGYPRRALDVLRARVLNRNPPLPPWRRRAIIAWQVLGTGPGPSTPPSRLQLFGVIAAWNEDDIIHATVRNLYTQGCDQVFVIDDDSDDETRREALDAGATVISCSSDGTYREAARSAAIASLIAAETAVAGNDVWWLVADADEFPRGNCARTIRQVVIGLPGWVDVVGSRVIEHLPHPGAKYLPRTHPVAAFPWAHEYHNPYCRLGHWKHQLIRVRTADDVKPMPGQHTVAHRDGRPAREWPQEILMHHVPLRGHERTATRLRRAAGPGGRYARTPDTFTRRRVHQRLHALDLLYEGRTQEVPNGFPDQPIVGVDLTDWRNLVSAKEHPVAAVP